jgi:hypothetical protein
MKIIFCTLILWTLSATATEQRIGGDYTLKSIEAIKQGYRLDFTSVVKTDHFNDIFIETDHVRFDMVQGQTYRISAEIPQTKNTKSLDKATAVSQLMVYLPQPQGPTPVWILSTGYQGELKGAKLLEMHNPSSDFMVF